MGFTPRDVDAMTLWEFAAAVQGWTRANGGESRPKPPTPEEHDALMAMYA